MKLTELFTGNKQIETNAKAQQSPAANNSIINRQIQALKPGQTLQGEVVARNGSEVQIRLSDDMTIKARVDQNMNLEVGKTMTFEVKNNGQTLTLAPLYTNTATDANVLKALDMASLPVNAETIAMTEQMMKAGLSIDKNSLQQLYRECNLHPQSNVSDIVDLHKLSMPVNEQNLTQIASYKNLTHQLVNGLNEVANALPDTMQGMMESGNIEGAAKLFQDILNLVANNGEIASGTGQENAQTGSILAGNDGGTVVFTENALVQNSQVNGNGTVQGDLQLLFDLLAARNGAEGVTGGENQVGAQQPVMSGQEAVVNQEGQLQNPVNGQLGEGVQNPGKELQSGSANASAVNANTINASNLQNQTMQQLTGNEIVNQGQGNSAQALEVLQRLLQQGIENKDTALLQSLMNHKEVKAFLKEILQKAWTLNPSDVAEGEKVKQLYQRLENQMKGLAQVLEAANQTNSETYRATTNLTQNLDFLQQINQTYTYMQLPLRLQQGNNAHGDLYVYSNKKHLAAKDGKITALLHLDMEHLGPLDVYVAMQYEKVSTKFYVQDEEMLDFLAEHMDLLTQRLKKRGYDCSFEMQTREGESEAGKTENVVQRLLEKEPHIPIVQYAFDVRT